MKSDIYKTFFLLICGLLINCFTAPVLDAQIPKREFRAVWVATVANIDWPSRPGLSTEEQKIEVIRILDRHKEIGMNAIILQVRPAADALYSSDYEPWSRYLSGSQGVAPDPLYDPLAFWIDEAHKRGMELHAWLNPYRIRLNQDHELDSSHMMFDHPEWTFMYGGQTYYSPAIPGVWQFLTEVVIDVVGRYDIDAVHFDDYFYPYQVSNEIFPDDSLFERYGGEFYPDRKDDWRRQNVDTIIHRLSIAIKSTKPWVKFGISPFGVWRNRMDDPDGSETMAGTSNYDGLYADVTKWQREGWIDYLMPQIYWRDDHPVADFSTLAYWWNDAAFGREVYVGLAPYRIDRKSEFKLWKRDRFFLQQLSVLRSLDHIHGYGMFSSKHFFRDDLSRLNRKLQRKYAKYPAIIPSMPWIDNTPPEYPMELSSSGLRLKWKVKYVENEFDKPRFFVIYRYDASEERNLKSADKIIAVTGLHYYEFDKEIPKGVYRVAALDRLNNESQLSDPLVIQ
ncbi:MAG: family 10 glycosylhydrolase [Bacteroidales bacterium]